MPDTFVRMIRRGYVPDTFIRMISRGHVPDTFVRMTSRGYVPDTFVLSGSYKIGRYDIYCVMIYICISFDTVC